MDMLSLAGPMRLMLCWQSICIMNDEMQSLFNNCIIIVQGKQHKAASAAEDMTHLD